MKIPPKKQCNVRRMALKTSITADSSEMQVPVAKEVKFKQNVINFRFRRPPKLIKFTKNCVKDVCLSF